MTINIIVAMFQLVTNPERPVIFHKECNNLLANSYPPNFRTTTEALPGVLGIQGEGLFIFRDLGRRVIYFQGYGEKAGFWGAGSRGLRKNILGSWGERSFFFLGAGSKDPPWGSLTTSYVMMIWK